MSLKSALFSALTAVVLIFGLGNRPLTDAVQDRSGGAFGLTSRAVVSFYTWDPGRLPDELTGPTVVSLVAFVALAALLGGLAGRARPLAAFIGGWGAAVLAMVVASGLFTLTADEQLFGSFARSSNALDRMTAGLGRGAAPGLWTGWVIGLAVLLGSLGAKQPPVEGRSAPSWIGAP